MKASINFTSTIENHLKALAAGDPLFAATLKKPNKNINDCCTYILNEVQKTKRNGFTDDEIFGMAIHYYDEDDVKVGKAVNARVVVNHTGTEDKTPVTRKKPAAKAPAVPSGQTTLF